MIVELIVFAEAEFHPLETLGLSVSLEMNGFDVHQPGFISSGTSDMHQ